jgi:hypothetical protein
MNYQFPNPKSADLEEQRLGILLRSYTHETRAFDQDFVDLLKNKFGFQYQEEIKSNIQNEIVNFIEKYGYLPRKTSKEINEKKLGIAWLGYCSKRCKSDEKFVNQYSHVPMYKIYRNNEAAKQAVAYYEKNGVVPPKKEFLGRFVISVKHGRILKLDEKLKQAILNMKSWPRVCYRNKNEKI